MSESIQALVSLSAYQPTRAHLFPSLESARWFVRKNKQRLIAVGALLRIAGRDFVQPEKFDGAVIEIGKDIAARKAAA
jgi:hypothetical protein